MSDFIRGFLVMTVGGPLTVMFLVAMIWMLAGANIPAQKDQFFLGMGAGGALLFLALMFILAAVAKRIT